MTIHFVTPDARSCTAHGRSSTPCSGDCIVALENAGANARLCAAHLAELGVAVEAESARELVSLRGLIVAIQIQARNMNQLGTEILSLLGDNP